MPSALRTYTLVLCGQADAVPVHEHRDELTCVAGIGEPFQHPGGEDRYRPVKDPDCCFAPGASPARAMDWSLIGAGSSPARSGSVRRVVLR